MPEDRKRNGIVPIMSVGQNMSLAALDQFTSSGVLNDTLEANQIRESVQRLTVKTPNTEIAISNLSGGNQVKNRCPLSYTNFIIFFTYFCRNFFGLSWQTSSNVV